MLNRSSGIRRGREITLQIGAKPIPGHELCRVRGQGNCGVVWEATTSAGPMALKFIPCKQMNMVVQELRTLMALRDLDHPNLLRYQQIWCHAGYLILSMELADSNLDDLFEAYQMEFGTGIVAEHLCLLLLDAAQGIDYLNARDSRWGGSGKGLQHCDIKPSNLLLCQDRVKVADFGLANRIASSRDTKPLGGTPAFCAPEVFQGRVSPHTDQFALAVSYYQLRTGKLPFDDTPATMKGACTRMVPDLSLLTDNEQVVVVSRFESIPFQAMGELFGIHESAHLCGPRTGLQGIGIECFRTWFSARVEDRRGKRLACPPQYAPRGILRNGTSEPLIPTVSLRRRTAHRNS